MDLSIVNGDYIPTNITGGAPPCSYFFNGPVEIVSFPSYKMVDLSSSFCKRLPGRVYPGVPSNEILSKLGIPKDNDGFG